MWEGLISRDLPFRVAHSSRVLAIASRDRELFLGSAGYQPAPLESPAAPSPALRGSLPNGLRAAGS